MIEPLAGNRGEARFPASFTRLPGHPRVAILPL